MLEKKRRQTRHLPAFILLVLAQEPRHGGAIHDALVKRLPGLKIDTGAIYRALKTLEADGELSSVWDASTPGPARKIYHMTAKGWDRLDSWKSEIENRRAILGDFLAAYAGLSRP
ncbi:transcriptional regulator, PadR-like family [Solidesulfovibrio fructosivorans JJ]]|uniref:Transcriptional regulator, PadR-like family n=1 Tax=Solidesulfovibrio fructosivorans JJ] TaxID=596151 RepID=E1JZ57_SOLFR|nr:PadR family transcriptional regulator [Solidesulfovibrio fructosivorans]EFL50340.1 transcriptional regulator, PadR-like family [Solidesulfovibrio fructosivorans JJ]]